MADVIVIQNDMSHEGRRNLHVMSGEPLDQAQALRRWAQTDNPYRLNVQMSEDEIHLHHLTATWLAREAMYYTFRREGTGKQHRVVAWALEPVSFQNGEEIASSQRTLLAMTLAAAVDAALAFYGTFGYWPSAAWVRTWPKGLKEEDAFIPISEGFGMDLFAVQWAMDGFVIVGGGLSATRVADTADGGSKPPRLVSQNRR